LEHQRICRIGEESDDEEGDEYIPTRSMFTNVRRERMYEYPEDDEVSETNPSNYETPNRRTHSSVPPQLNRRREVDEESFTTVSVRSMGYAQRELFSDESRPKRFHEESFPAPPPPPPAPQVSPALRPVRQSVEEPSTIDDDDTISLHSRDSVRRLHSDVRPRDDVQLSNLRKQIRESENAVADIDRQIVDQFRARNTLTAQFQMLQQRRYIVEQQATINNEFVEQAKRSNMPPLGTEAHGSALAGYLGHLINQHNSVAERDAIVSAIENASKQFDAQSAQISSLELEKQRLLASTENLRQTHDMIHARTLRCSYE
jgi:hypothetical protein